MSDEHRTTESAHPRRRWWSIGLRDLLLLVVIVAICLAWWIDRSRPESKQYDVAGPVTVNYTYSVSSNTNFSNTVDNVRGIDFEGGFVVLHTDNGGRVLSSDTLTRFSWRPE